MTPQPDFLRPSRGPHPLAWAACATALAVLGIAALESWQARQQQPPPAAAVATRSPAPAASRADSEAQRSLQQAAARLDRRWDDRFAALDAVETAGIAWLAIEIGDGGRLRLQGQAADSAAAMAAAEALRRQGGWHDVLLGRMEGAAGGTLVFEIAAEASP